MIKNVIFDWSGVVTNDIVPVHKAIMAMFRKFGVKEMSVEEFRREWEQPYMRFYQRYGMFAGPDQKKNEKEEVALYRSYLKAALSDHPIECYPGMRNVLLGLWTKGINMIVVSSNLKETLEADLDNFLLRGVFREINHGVHDKSKNIRKTVKRNKFISGETVFVGDTPHEIESGKAARLKTCGVTWGFSSEEKLGAFNPDYIVHSPSELESLILAKKGEAY